MHAAFHMYYRQLASCAFSLFFLLYNCMAKPRHYLAQTARGLQASMLTYVVHEVHVEKALKCMHACFYAHAQLHCRATTLFAAQTTRGLQVWKLMCLTMASTCNAIQNLEPCLRISYITIYICAFVSWIQMYIYTSYIYIYIYICRTYLVSLFKKRTNLHHKKVALPIFFKC